MDLRRPAAEPVAPEEALRHCVCVDTIEPCPFRRQQTRKGAKVGDAPIVEDDPHEVVLHQTRPQPLQPVDAEVVGACRTGPAVILPSGQPHDAPVLSGGPSATIFAASWLFAAPVACGACGVRHIAHKPKSRTDRGPFTPAFRPCNAATAVLNHRADTPYCRWQQVLPHPTQERHTLGRGR